MMDFAKQLIGAQLVSWDDLNNQLVVRRFGREYVLTFDDTDEGDCCGYNVLSAELFIEENSSRNPVIVKCTEEYTQDDCCERMQITFFGEHKKLLCLSSESGSGSGFSYGAVVTVRCSELQIDETVTGW